MRSFLGWEKNEVAKRIEHALELAHALVIDHVRPVSQGGSDDFDNLAASCVECNIGKSDRWSRE